ncbi:DEAD/DEAH box helicase [Microbacterium kribbense]|uniref:DEAD/DEAH box helicase n=1 Tax=Microbacterium kribbense TaxID=433645 RepID=A0ABP7GNK6_9MICO
MTPPQPSWRDLVADAPAGAPASALALGVELRQRQGGGAATWSPQRVTTATARSIATTDGELLVGLRPLVRSAATGNWIKGTVSWDALRRGGAGFRADQARWFAELYSIGHDARRPGPFADASEWVTLDTIASGLLWPHLAAAAGRDIPIVATAAAQIVRLAGAGAVALQVVRARAGGLLLQATTTIDGRRLPDAGGPVRPVGATGVYAVAVRRSQITLTLAPAPLDDAVRTLLPLSAGIAVPPAEVDAFLRQAYPRLARRATVTAGPGVTLPEPAPPHLEVAVRFRPRESIDVALTWVYADGSRYALDEPAGPGRDADAETAVRERVERAWTDAAPGPLMAAVSLRGIECAEFVDKAMPALVRLDGVRLAVQGRQRSYRELVGDPEITVTTVAGDDPDWFDLGVLVRIDGHSIPFRPLFTALAQRRTALLLTDGTYFSLKHPGLDRLRELIDESGDVTEWETGPRISRYQTALWEDFEDLADVSEPAVSWRATADGLRDVEHLEPTPLPAGLHARLRPYQRAGYDWLAFLWRHRLGGILADDMGLGKTLQLLALIAHTRQDARQRPFLVVAPTSVVETWRAEAARFTPGLRVQVIDATRAARPARPAPGTAAHEAVDIVLTSYTLLRLDEAEFTATQWAGVVFDEAQFVKNPATRLHHVAAQLQADVKYAITGTPLENSLTDLWALFALTAPGLFPSARRFRQDYVGPIEQGKVPENQEGAPFRTARLARLRRRIRPLLLRRTKEIVATELPPKQEQLLAVELTGAHRAIYDTVLQRERQKILGLLEDLDRNRFIVFRSLTLLRMLSLAPGLIDPADARVRSAKLEELVAQVAQLAAEGHRALVFSQFTSFLERAAARLDAAGIAHEYLDGTTRRRPEVIERFRTGGAPVFLISLKAGGFGLTLTEADYVFLLDPWWNPAAEEQAIDRAHRIGQTRSVFVYRMIARGTIEEKVVALQARKARLFHAVMDDDDLFARSLTADDIRGLFEG